MKNGTRVLTPDGSGQVVSSTQWSLLVSLDQISESSRKGARRWFVRSRVRPLFETLSLFEVA